MIALLYAATSAFILWLVRRLVSPISLVAAIILVLLPLLFVAKAVLTDAVYAPVDLPYETEPLKPLRQIHGVEPPRNGNLGDIAWQLIPWRAAVRDALARGEWPLLNRHMLSGEVLAAAAQPAVYSPFTLLACLLPVAKSFTFTGAITFFLAALGAFLFARELGCREASALVASAAWMFSTGLAFFILWPLGLTWAFFFFVLLATRRVVAVPSMANAAFLTTVFVLMLLAGHPETVIHIVVIGAFYGLFRLFRERRRPWKAIAFSVGAGFVSLLLCAIYLLPLLDIAPQTAEHAYRSQVWAKQDRGVNAGQSLARIATDLVPTLYLQTWVDPRVGGTPTYDSAAVGSIALALAVFAIWRVRTAESWFFTILFVFGFLMRAEARPLARIVGKIPLLDLCLNERFSFAAAASLALLAAVGVEVIARDERRRSAAVTSLIVLILLTALTLWIERSGFTRGDLHRWAEYKVAAEIGLLAVAVGVLLMPLRPQHLLAVLFGLLLSQRVASEEGTYPTIPASSAYPPIPIFDSLDRSEPFRVVGFWYDFVPGTAALYGVEDPRGYAALTLRRYLETYPLWSMFQPVWFNRIEDPTRPFLSFLNVKYAVTGRQTTLPWSWKLVTEKGGARLWENERVLPRAYVPSTVRVGLPDWMALLQMKEETDFSKMAWIKMPEPPGDRTNGPGTVTIRPRKLGFEFDVNMEGAGWMVMSQPAWNGWRAYVDGKRLNMHIANVAFLSLHIPKGRHFVRIVYWPHSFVIGRWISFGTLSIVVIAASVALWRRRRRAITITEQSP